ncbi:MAG: DUF86 domain-containing protein [Desulfomonile tiedjei]|uniref:DUF86 domain-containing protein n=1 Tax=Desulfomonile tiedjei TaxID=2358 RepID=A0A9D6UZZ2_9BACT|nr:DUF86 domain-containing protein [Desulfomonile tiedjei]
MPRDYRLYLDDILESCRKIRQFTQDMSFQEFERDVKTQDAVIRNFEVIGEAANRLPEDVKSLYPDVEWAKIIGFRNILIHEYFGVKLETVWTAISEKIPILEEETKSVLGEET